MIRPASHPRTHGRDRIGPRHNKASGLHMPRADHPDWSGPFELSVKPLGKRSSRFEAASGPSSFNNVNSHSTTTHPDATHTQTTQTGNDLGCRRWKRWPRRCRRPRGALCPRPSSSRSRYVSGGLVMELHAHVGRGRLVNWLAKPSSGRSNRSIDHHTHDPMIDRSTGLHPPPNPSKPSPSAHPSPQNR